MKDARVFLGREEKQGFFWVVKKGLTDFLGYAKKSSDFFGYKIGTSVTPPPPPPSLKFVSVAPGQSTR